MLRTGIVSGLQSGLRVGLNPFGGAPELLLDLNFEEATAVSASGGSSLATWLFDEPSGNFVDEVGGEELTPASVSREPMVGLWSGSDFYSRNGARFGGGSIEAAAGDNAFFDQSASDSFAVFAVFRSTNPAGNPANTLFGKQTSTATAGFVSLFSGATRIRTVVRDDAATQVTVDHNGDHNDGAWHFFAMVVNRTAQTLTCYSDVNTTPTSGSISAVGSPSIAAPFKVGRAANYNGAEFDCALVSLWQGAAVESFGQATFEALFNHANPPSPISAYTRASAAAPIVGNESGFGVRVGKYSAGQFAHAWRSAFSHPSKVGMIVEPAATNVITYSEDFADASWTGNDYTITTNATTAPDGTATADLLSFDAIGADLRVTLGTATGNDYTFSIFMKAATAPQDVDIRISSGAGATTTCNLTTEWQRFEVTVNAGTSGVFLVEADSGDCYIWGAQVERASTATSYIPTSGASASRVETGWTVPNLRANNWVDHFQGELWVNYVGGSGGNLDLSIFIENTSGGGARNAKRMVPSASNSTRIYDQDAALIQTFTESPKPAGIEETFRLAWDANAEIEGTRGRIVRNDVITQYGFGAGYDAGTQESEMRDGSVNTNYVASRIQIYREPQVVEQLLVEMDFTTTSQPAELDTYARASVAAPITGDGANGVEVTKFASGEYAYAYNAAFSHASKLGMLIEPAATNLFSYSEQFNPASGWNGQFGATVTLNQATAPDGTLTADRVDFAGTGAARVSEAPATAASTAYVFSVFVRAVSGTDDLRLEMRESDGAATTEIAAQTFTVGEQWERIQITGTTLVDTVSIGCEINEKTGGGGSFYIWGAQLEAGTLATSYIPTSGGSASRVACEPLVSDLRANDYMRHDRGALVMDFLWNQYSTNVYLWRMEGASGQNRKLLFVPSGGTDFRLYDDSGTEAASRIGAVLLTNNPDQEYSVHCAWNAAANSGSIDNGENTGSATYGVKPYVVPDLEFEQDLYIGNNAIGGLHHNGLIARIAIYTQEQV